MRYIEKIKKGGKLSATDYNLMRKTVMDLDSSRITPRSESSANTAVIIAKNTTGETLPEFSVVGLEEYLYESRNSTESKWRDSVSAQGVQMNAILYPGKGAYGITLRRAPVEALLPVLVSGPAGVMVRIDEEAQAYEEENSQPLMFATPEKDELSLVARPAGPAQVLWRDSGSGTEHYAFVRIGPRLAETLFCRTDSDLKKWHDSESGSSTHNAGDLDAYDWVWGTVIQEEDGGELTRIKLYASPLMCDDDTIPRGPVHAMWFESWGRYVLVGYSCCDQSDDSDDSGNTGGNTGGDTV